MKPPRIPQVGIDMLRKQVTRNMPDTVRVVRPGLPIYDPVSQLVTGHLSAYDGYEGVAHVQPAQPNIGYDPGMGITVISTVVVSLPWDADPLPRNEDQLVVLTCADPSFVGLTLRILTVKTGGIGYVTRELSCTFTADNPFDTA